MAFELAGERVDRPCSPPVREMADKVSAIVQAELIYLNHNVLHDADELLE
jgi:hypothetical protein